MGRHGRRRIRVKVIARASRPTLVLRWIDKSGRSREQTTDFKATKQGRRQAERFAQDFEDRLNNASANNMRWADFEKRYLQEHLSALSEGSRSKWRTVVHMFNEAINPEGVDDITAESLSEFANSIRQRGVSESTVAGYMRQLKAGLNWGHRLGIIAKAPIYRSTRRTRGFSSQVRSRVITREEFERIEKVAGSEYKLFLRSMFDGSLRLSEATELTWHRSKFCVDFDGNHPMYRILAEGEKGHRDRLLPIAPEFADVLIQHRKPKGRVCQVFAKRTMQHRIRDWSVKANVYVAENTPCTAQDLRKAFGTRWAKSLMPAQLQQLMRHQSIATTMKHYVRIEADELAHVLYAQNSALGDKTGDMACQPKMSDELSNTDKPLK